MNVYSAICNGHCYCDQLRHKSNGIEIALHFIVNFVNFLSSRLVSNALRVSRSYFQFYRRLMLVINQHFMFELSYLSVRYKFSLFFCTIVSFFRSYQISMKNRSQIKKMCNVMYMYWVVEAFQCCRMSLCTFFIYI